MCSSWSSHLAPPTTASYLASVAIKDGEVALVEEAHGDLNAALHEVDGHIVTLEALGLGKIIIEPFKAVILHDLGHLPVHHLRVVPSHTSSVWKEELYRARLIHMILSRVMVSSNIYVPGVRESSSIIAWQADPRGGAAQVSEPRTKGTISHWGLTIGWVQGRRGLTDPGLWAPLIGQEAQYGHSAHVCSAPGQLSQGTHTSCTSRIPPHWDNTLHHQLGNPTPFHLLLFLHGTQTQPPGEPHRHTPLPTLQCASGTSHHKTEHCKPGGTQIIWAGSH